MNSPLIWKLFDLWFPDGRHDGVVRAKANFSVGGEGLQNCRSSILKGIFGVHAHLYLQASPMRMLFPSRYGIFTPNHSESRLDSAIHPPGHRSANATPSTAPCRITTNPSQLWKFWKKEKPSLQLLLFMNKERVGREGEGGEEETVGRQSQVEDEI